MNKAQEDAQTCLDFVCKDFVCKDCNETCLDNSGSIPMNKAQEDAQTCTSFVKIVMKHV